MARTCNRDLPPSIRDFQHLLPEVGDKLLRKPEIGRCYGYTDARATECVVTYVHCEHLWYEVRFPSGIRQSYKLPAIRSR